MKTRHKDIVNLVISICYGKTLCCLHYKGRCGMSSGLDKNGENAGYHGRSALYDEPKEWF